MMERRNVGVAQAPPPPPPDAPPEAKLDYIAQQLYRLVEMGEQLIGQVPLVLEPKIVPGLCMVPLGAKSLNEAIQAMGLHGVSFFPSTKLTWLCPAGATTIFPISIPEGYIATCTDYDIDSDFYDENLTVNVYVDDRLVTPFGVSLTGPTAMDYAEYNVKYTGAVIETINNTATDAQLSFHFFGCFLEKSFYEEFYKPIMEYMRTALEGVARHGQV